MKTTLLVVMDLGGYKAFRIDHNHFNGTPRLELIEEFTNLEAHTRLIDKVTDLSGRFPRSTAAPNVRHAMSDGERHNLEREIRRRSIRQLARRLMSLVRGVERCYLAASREIRNMLWDELSPDVQLRIEMNVPADLTKVDKSQLFRYFPAAARPVPAGSRVWS